MEPWAEIALGEGMRKRTKESLEWRELLKSARPLEFSPVVNYPKKEITVEFDHSPPLSPCRSVFKPPPLSLPLSPPPFSKGLVSFSPRSSHSWVGPSVVARSRDRRSLFSRVKNPLDEERAAVSDKKLAGVANVSTLNHIFIATLIQPF